MPLKTFVASVAVIFSLTVSPIYASSWTVAATGTITSGFDGGGIFGAIGQNLAGDPYTLTIITDPNLNANDLSNHPSSSDTTGGTFYGVYGVQSTITATVNGESFTRIINPNISGIITGDSKFGQNIQGVWNSPGFSAIQSSNTGYAQTIDSFINGDINVNSGYAFLSSGSFNQSVTYTIQGGDTASVYWTYEGVINNGYSGVFSNFSGNITSISINQQTTVPIPAAFWLFGSAFTGLIGFMRRKLF